MGTRQFVIAAVLPLAMLTACIDNADFDGPSTSASPAMIEDGRAIDEAN